MKDDASQFFVFQREHALRFGVQFHLDDGQRVGGGEVALRVPPSGKKIRSPKRNVGISIDIQFHWTQNDYIGLDASAWSVCNFSPPSTSMVQ